MKKSMEDAQPGAASSPFGSTVPDCDTRTDMGSPTTLSLSSCYAVPYIVSSPAAATTDSELDFEQETTEIEWTATGGRSLVGVSPDMLSNFADVLN